MEGLWGGRVWAPHCGRALLVHLDAATTAPSVPGACLFTETVLVAFIATVSFLVCITASYCLDYLVAFHDLPSSPTLLSVSFSNAVSPALRRLPSMWQVPMDTYSQEVKKKEASKNRKEIIPIYLLHRSLRGPHDILPAKSLSQRWYMVDIQQEFAPFPRSNFMSRMLLFFKPSPAE